MPIIVTTKNGKVRGNLVKWKKNIIVESKGKNVHIPYSDIVYIQYIGRSSRKFAC